MWCCCLCRWCQWWRHQQQKTLASPQPLPLWPLTLARTCPQTASHLTLTTSPSAQPVSSVPPTRPSRDNAEAKRYKSSSSSSLYVEEEEEEIPPPNSLPSSVYRGNCKGNRESWSKGGWRTTRNRDDKEERTGRNRRRTFFIWLFSEFSHLSTCWRAQGVRKGTLQWWLVLNMETYGGAAQQGNMRIRTNVHVLLNFIISFTYFYMHNRYIFLLSCPRSLVEWQGV